MKYIKMLGLLAVAAAALMAFPGTASATEITSSTGSTPTINATNVGQLELHGPVGSVICQKSTVAGTITSHGAGQPATGPISTLNFTECNEHVTVVKRGWLVIHVASSTGNGTLVSEGAEVTVVQTTIFGDVHCIYATGTGVHLGSITGAASGTGHAVLNMSGSVPRVVTSGLCGSEPSEWTGSYKVNHPTGFQVH
jgi:hypothetical protein